MNRMFLFTRRITSVVSMKKTFMSGSWISRSLSVRTLSGFQQHNGAKNLLFRPALFTTCVCFGGFGVVPILQFHNENRRSTSSVFGDMFTTGRTSSWWRLPSMFYDHLSSSTAQSIEHFMNSVSAQYVGPILLLNTSALLLLSLLKQNGRLPLFLDRLFVHHPQSGKSLPLILSCFNHVGPIHFAFNMYILYQFGLMMVHTFHHSSDRFLSKYRPHQFYATYFSACVISSFISVCLSVTMHRLRGHPYIPGVGASGAILALFAMLSLINENALASIIFIPQWEFRAIDALHGMIVFDLVGILLGWKFLGHGAHLGGVLFGYWMIKLDGTKYIDMYQLWILKQYKKLYERYEKELLKRQK